MKPPTLLYCHCQYAQVLPKEVKQAVLQRLCDSGQPFEAVPDLCEFSARHDPALARLAAAGSIKIAACYPRAVKWLFAAAGSPLSAERTEIVNLRTLTASEACASLFDPAVKPNLPAGKPSPADAPTAREPAAAS